MSEIKVNSIKGVGASTAAITVNNTDGSCAVNNTQRQGKNLIINGAMNVAQRGSASSTTNGLATVDRFKKIGAGLGNTFSQEQISLSSSDTPYSSGFRKAFRVSQDQAGTANASGAIDFSHYIEAQNIAGSGWNYTSASSKITLQFWFRASTNQTFYGVLYTPDGTVQTYPFSFTASGNNTWTKITHTIPGNSNITIDNNNGTGLILYLIPFYGTDYTDNSKSVNAWSAHSTNFCPDMASTWLTAGASTFDVTGMQLEVSDHATSFEFLSFADEFQKCLRYYEQMSSNGVSVAYFATGYCESTTEANYPILFKAYKRATPTVTSTAGSTFRNHHTGTSVDCSNIVFNLATPMSCRAQTVASSAVLGDGNAACLAAHSSTEALIKIDAEL